MKTHDKDKADQAELESSLLEKIRELLTKEYGQLTIKKQLNVLMIEVADKSRIQI